MQTSNPLLDMSALPRFAEIAPEQIAPALDQALAKHAAAVAAITSARPTDFAAAWLPFERAETELSNLWAAVSHLHGVADTPELRAAYLEGEARLVENEMAVGQNRELYETFARIRDGENFSSLSVEDRAAVELAVRDFKLSGVALDPECRERFKQISVELSRLSSEFGSAVMDATDAWSEHVTEPAVLAGLSQADMAMLAVAAEERGLGGWLVTLQQPSVNAVMTFAEDRGLRERVYRAYGTRASDQGPNAGLHDNGPRIARIMELRREAAALLGFADPVAWSLATKMASSGAEVLDFLRDLARRARPSAEKDLADLRALATERLGLDELRPWDVSFVSDRLLWERYAVDEQEVRSYFPVLKVVMGWRNLLTRLFGIVLVERSDVSLYHPDAKFFDVVDDGGSVIAGLYVDLYARTGKRGGAWMDRARPKLDRSNGDASVPVAYLVCNFSPDAPGAPSLLSHDDVVTLLHETGHCLHLLLTEVGRPSVGGISGFEWDAVELPSQLMEDFAWDAEVLTEMSGHVDTGAAIPGSLFARMLAARHFQSGLMVLRQIEFAMFDLLLHLGTMGSDPMEVIEAVRDEIAVSRPPEWHRFPHAFRHIFADGYASGYYSYLWAELLAADGFRRFAEAGLVDRATGELFRREILARGATRPAADSFRAFRGRDADPAAMLIRRGLATAP